MTFFVPDKLEFIKTLLFKKHIGLATPYVEKDQYDSVNNEWIKKIAKENALFHDVFYTHLREIESGDIWFMQLSPNPFAFHYMETALPIFVCTPKDNYNYYLSAMAGYSNNRDIQDFPYEMNVYSDVIAIFSEKSDWILIWERDGGNDPEGLDDGFHFYTKKNI